MNKLLKILIVSLVVVIFSFVNAISETTLWLFHTNDIHSHLLPWGPKDVNGKGMYGGIARISTVVKQARTAHPDSVLLLDAGDAFVGDFIYNVHLGAAELTMMNKLSPSIPQLPLLDYNAMAVGNHEFDLTPQALAGVLSGTSAFRTFPLLSANLDSLDNPKAFGLDKLIQPYKIINVAGIKVGIFGLTTEEVTALSNPEPVFATSAISTAMAMVDTLNNYNVDLIIALSHLGLQGDKALAEAVPAIDVIVGGHSHTIISTPIKIGNTLIVQTGCNGRYLGKMQLRIADNDDVTLQDYKLISVDNTISEDPVVAGFLQTAFVTPTLQKFPGIYDSVATTSIKLLGDEPNVPGEIEYDAEYVETNLGNLITDAIRNKTGTAVALEGAGVIRQSIYPGTITPNDIFQVCSVGYDPVSKLGFKLVTADISSGMLWITLQYGLSMVGTSNFLQVSGIKMKYDSSSGSLVSVEVGGTPINPLDYFTTHTITVNEYLYSFASGLGIQVSNVKVTDFVEYEVVRDYIISLSPIDESDAKVEGRIVDIATSVSEKNPVASSSTRLVLHQNYPNPFYPETVISYVIAGDNSLVPRPSSLVTLNIYSITGQLVRTLVNEYKDVGIYNIRWDGKDDYGNIVNSGVYLYRLKSGNITSTRRMILMK